MEALDKHNLATFVRAREGYSWMFLQRDFDQVARMAVPAVFADYNRQFEGDAAPCRRRSAPPRTGASTSSACGWPPPGAPATRARPGHLRQGGAPDDRNLPEVTTRHVASVVFQYQPKVLAKERDRLENPFGFVVTAYRSDPEINTAAREPSHEAALAWLAASAARCPVRRRARRRSRRPAPARGGLRPAPWSPCPSSAAS
jgi:type IV secretion system protein VirB8